MKYVRIIVAIAIASAINWGLLSVMQYLIATGEKALSDDSKVHFVDFVRVKRDETVAQKETKPKKPPKPDTPPPTAPPRSQDAVNPNAISTAMAPLTADTGMNIGGLSYGNADGDYLPIVKVAPIYPRRALTRGLEGWVLLEFTVTKLGTVVDIKVLESDPPGIFDKAAVGAAAKFKYKPKVVNGEPIDTAGVLHRISFELED
ncbi:MAG: energy transducer TonB [Gammaproteobacteria bacterium]|jgi:protein TonB|nr:energy transducer TonB [Gammaproteobacteria bacterium]